MQNQINFKENKPFMDWLQKNKLVLFNIVKEKDISDIFVYKAIYNDILKEFERWLDEINAEIKTKLLLNDLGVLTY